MIWLLVGTGGALGAMTRFGVSEWMLGRVDDGLPWATFAVNILGALLLGLLLGAVEGASDSRDVRLFAAVGFLGSFTTFSTFSLEVVRLGQESGWMRGGVWAGGSLLLGVVGVLAGLWLGSALRSG